MIDLVKLIGTLANENDFKKRFRLHQGWWRAFVIGENEGRHPIKKDEHICNTLLNGKRTNRNFISSLVRNVVDKVLDERSYISSGIVDENRLFNNLLSSQPLCFNFFAPFYRDKKLALNFLRKFYPNVTLVNEVCFEFSNSENKFDNSAFDIAFDVNDGSKRGIIGFECKYTDTFSSKEYDKLSYKNIYQNSNIWEKPYDELTKSKFNQLFRNQLIAESFKQNKQYDFAHLALFCHHSDEEAIKIAEEYKLMLMESENYNFGIITYKDFFEQIMKLELSWFDREYFMLLWARYCALKLSNIANEQLKEIEKGEHKVYDVDENDLLNKKFVGGMEGGAIFTAERNGELYVIVNVATLIDIASEEDKKALCPISIYKFNNHDERNRFLKKYKTKLKSDDDF